MYYSAKASSNTGLVRELKRLAIIQSKRVEEAMLLVDRGNFAPPGVAYEDSPHGIGAGQTISAPHMHVHALQLLEDHLQPGAKALDVGCGSGYLTACMAHMVGSAGKVVGIEVVPSLATLSVDNLNKGNGDLLSSGRVEIKVQDGWQGDPVNAPFDCIHVGAAASSLPQNLVNQLRPGGMMVIPIGPQHGSQEFVKITKDADGRVTRESLFGVRYVPLVQT